jgi:hypothetical protein
MLDISLSESVLPCQDFPLSFNDHAKEKQNGTARDSEESKTRQDVRSATEGRRGARRSPRHRRIRQITSRLDSRNAAQSRAGRVNGTARRDGQGRRHDGPSKMLSQPSEQAVRAGSVREFRRADRVNNPLPGKKRPSRQTPPRRALPSCRFRARPRDRKWSISWESRYEQASVRCDAFAGFNTQVLVESNLLWTSQKAGLDSAE